MPSVDSPQLTRLAYFLDVAAARYRVVASNIANLDTPGYRTRDIDFRRELERASADPEMPPLVPAAHQVQGLVERPDGNNVNADREALLLAETQLQFRVGVELVRAEFRRLSTAINEGRSQ